MANTYTYPHVEDYIEIIAGYRAPDGSSKYSIFYTPESPISLARYDVQVVQSFGEQSKNNVSFTDKQAALATSIVVKYERQLAKLGVDIAPVKSSAVFRNPIRQIDRSRRAWVEDDKIYFKFPFEAKVIEVIREEARVSKGAMRWNHDKKTWVADLTEYNANWVYAFAQANEFEIAPELKQLMAQLLEAERTPYKIELRYNNNQVEIANAADSLVEHIRENVCEFTPDNLLALVDRAPIYAYTLDPVIQDTVKEAYGTNFYKLCAHRETQVGPDVNEKYVADIVKYANETQRWPVYIYEPSLTNQITSLFAQAFAPEQVYKMPQKVGQVPDDARLVCVEKIPKKSVDRIPLLVSTAGMLFGGDRQVWIQNAEKVVYFTADVYNKNKQGKDICKLD